MVRMVLTGIGFVIGERVQPTDPSLLCLKNPRVIQVQSDAAGNAKMKDMLNPEVGFLKLLGSPEGFEISKNNLNYDVKEEYVLEAYKANVSGIIQPNAGNLIKMPGRPQ